MGLIRVLLALGVASAHTALPIPGFGVVPFSGYGAFDVSGFFTISGFYMALILDRKYLPLRNGLWLFYSNRIYRLLPAFAIVSGLSALMAYTSNQTSMLAWSHPLSVTLDRYSHLGLLWKIIIPIANTTYLFSDVLIWSAFLPNGTWTIDVAAPGAIAGSAFLLFPPGWSLSIELVFYLAAPLIVRLRCIWIGALALVSVLLRVWMFKHGYVTYVWMHTFLPTEFVYFLMGIAAYKFYGSIEGWRLTKWFGMVFLVGFVLVFGSFNRFAIGPDQMLGPYTATLALIIPFVFDATKDLRFDRILGELSYAIYVAHFIVWKTLAWLTGPPGAIVYFAVLILFAAVILRAVEMPIERLRKNRYARACEVASPAP